MDNLVSVSWLSEHINDKDLVILDASIYSDLYESAENYQDTCIPKARYFDIENVFSDTTSPFPHTILPPDIFEQESQKLGIGKASKIIVYDNLGIFTSPRAWWLFKIMGHQQVAVLNGGLPEWIKQGMVTETKNDNETYTIGNFKANYQKQWVKTFEDVEMNSKEPRFLLVDARSEGRFKGTEPEPREHLQSGSIPHSVNIPYSNVLNNGLYKTPKEIQAIFNKVCLENTDLVFSCGSGISACIIMLAAEIGFQTNKAIYDGSWTEWAIKNKLFTDKQK